MIKPTSNVKKLLMISFFSDFLSQEMLIHLPTKCLSKPIGLLMLINNPLDNNCCLSCSNLSSLFGMTTEAGDISWLTTLFDVIFTIAWIDRFFAPLMLLIVESLSQVFFIVMMKQACQIVQNTFVDSGKNSNSCSVNERWNWCIIKSHYKGKWALIRFVIIKIGNEVEDSAIFKIVAFPIFICNRLYPIIHYIIHFII